MTCPSVLALLIACFAVSGTAEAGGNACTLGGLGDAGGCHGKMGGALLQQHTRNPASLGTEVPAVGLDSRSNSTAGKDMETLKKYVKEIDMILKDRQSYKNKRDGDAFNKAIASDFETAVTTYIGKLHLVSDDNPPVESLHESLVEVLKSRETEADDCANAKNGSMEQVKKSCDVLHQGIMNILSCDFMKDAREAVYEQKMRENTSFNFACIINGTGEDKCGATEIQTDEEILQNLNTHDSKNREAKEEAQVLVAQLARLSESASVNAEQCLVDKVNIQESHCLLTQKFKDVCDVYCTCHNEKADGYREVKTCFNETESTLLTLSESLYDKLNLSETTNPTMSSFEEFPAQKECYVNTQCSFMVQEIVEFENYSCQLDAKANCPNMYYTPQPQTSQVTQPTAAPGSTTPSL